MSNPANDLMSGFIALMEGYPVNVVRDALANTLARAIQVEARTHGAGGKAYAAILVEACSRTVLEAVELNWDLP